MADNPFDDLVPQGQQTAANADPFGDLVPQQPQNPGFLSTLGQAGARGVQEGLRENAEGFGVAGRAVSGQGAFQYHGPEAKPDDYVSRVLQQPFSEGWSDPNWWAAQIAHGTGKTSPSLVMGLAGGAAGTAAAGPVGTLVGGAAGFGVGSIMQTLAPAYQRAREEGLGHDAAVDRAIKSAGVAGAFGTVMGLAPGAAVTGKTVEGALKRPIGEALAQIFGVQPAIGAVQQVTQQAGIEGKPVTADDLATGYATNVGSGLALTAGHRAMNALKPAASHVAPRERVEPSLPWPETATVAQEASVATQNREIASPQPPQTETVAQPKGRKARVESQGEPVDQGAAPVTANVVTAPIQPTLPVNPRYLQTVERMNDRRRERGELPQVEELPIQPRTPEQEAADVLKSATSSMDPRAASRALSWARDNNRPDIADALVQKAGDYALHLKDLQAEQNAQPTAKQAPVDMLGYIRNAGGIRDPNGELKALQAYERPGIINNKSGMNPDDMRSLLVQKGYLQDAPHEQGTRSSLSDLYSAIDDGLRGRKIYRPDDEAAAQQVNWNRTKSAVDEQEAHAIRSSIRDWHDTYDLPYAFRDAEEAEIISRVKSGMSVEDAVERSAIDWYNEVHDGAEAVGGRSRSGGAGVGEGREGGKGLEAQGRAVEAGASGKDAGAAGARGQDALGADDLPMWAAGAPVRAIDKITQRKIDDLKSALMVGHEWVGGATGSKNLTPARRAQIEREIAYLSGESSTHPDSPEGMSLDEFSRAVRRGVIGPAEGNRKDFQRIKRDNITIRTETPEEKFNERDRKIAPYREVYRRLIEKQVDGTITPAERAKLEATINAMRPILDVGQDDVLRHIDTGLTYGYAPDDIATHVVHSYLLRNNPEYYKAVVAAGSNPQPSFWTTDAIRSAYENMQRRSAGFAPRDEPMFARESLMDRAYKVLDPDADLKAGHTVGKDYKDGHSKWSGVLDDIPVDPKEQARIARNKPLYAAETDAPRGDQSAQMAVATMQLRRGAPYTVPEHVPPAVLNAIAPLKHIVPKGTPVGTLVRLEPGDFGKVRGTGDKVDTRAVFLTEDGTEFSVFAPRRIFTGARALFDPTTGGVGFFRMDAPRGLNEGFSAGRGDNGLDLFARSRQGELVHEVIHLLRRSGALPEPVWQRLLGQANALSVLDSDMRTYLQAIGNPEWKNSPPGVTVRDVYETLYKNRSDLREVLDQEAVTHMVELYHHGQLLPQEVGPIKNQIEDLLDGKYSRAPVSQYKGWVNKPDEAGQVAAIERNRGPPGGLFVDGVPKELDPLFEHARKFATVEQFMRNTSSIGPEMAGLDRIAFGVSDGQEMSVDPRKLFVKYPGDLDNAKSEKQVPYGDDAPPIDVSIQKINGKIRWAIEDGHHRYWAAKRDGKPVKIKIESIRANPYDVLGYDGFDDFMRDVYTRANSQSKPPLDMSHEARLKRAKEQGFDTGNPLYRGVGTPSNEFTANAGDWGKGVYLGNRPTASGYANQWNNYDNTNPAVYPVYVRGKFADVAKQLDVRDAVEKEFRKVKRKASDEEITDEANKRLSDMGYVGVTQGRNMSTLVFDPKNIRSTSAAFDPMLEGENGLLYAGGPKMVQADVLESEKVTRPSQQAGPKGDFSKAAAGKSANLNHYNSGGSVRDKDSIIARALRLVRGG